MFKIGDKITVLDDAIDGVVVKVNHKAVTVETTDGFELVFNENEIIKTGQSINISINSESMKRVLKEKEIPKPRSFVKEKKVREQPVPEFDLHIEQLVKNFRGMTNYEILSLQAETAKKHLEFAIVNRIPKIVFIHGVGEGILKAELDFMFGRYENIDFRDANYQKYGLGATEVYIRQNVK